MNLDQSVTSIMSTDVETVTPSSSLVDVKHIYEKQNFHHHIPVVEGENLVGMVSLIDFMRKIGNASLSDNDAAYTSNKVADIMVRNPLTAGPESTIKDIISILAKGEFHSVPITEGKELKGIITSSDIFKSLI